MQRVGRCQRVAKSCEAPVAVTENIARRNIGYAELAGYAAQIVIAIGRINGFKSPLRDNAALETIISRYGGRQTVAPDRDGTENDNPRMGGSYGVDGRLHHFDGVVEVPDGMEDDDIGRNVADHTGYFPVALDAQVVGGFDLDQ